MRASLAGPRILIAAAIVALVVTGGAVAYWTGIGRGTTETQLANPKSLILSAGSPSAQLYPGGHASVSAVAANPNPYLVHIGALELDAGAGAGGFEVDAAHSGCDVGALSFSTRDNGGNGWTVPPKAGASDGLLPVDMAGAVTMARSALDACQGAIFTVHLKATS